MTQDSRLFHLRSGGVSVVLDAAGDAVPRIVHWGRDLGVVSDSELSELARTSVPQIVSNSIDVPVPLGLLPDQTTGWNGTPGLSGHCDGRHFSAAFAGARVSTPASPDPRVGDRRVVVELADEAVELRLAIEVELAEGGVLRTRATLTSTGDGVYTLD